MTDLFEKFSQEISTLFLGKFPEKIAIAVSGGADSLALTLLLQKFCYQKKIKLFAVTIDHGIRNESLLEALALNKILKQKKIFHQILTIEKSLVPKSNVEATLRDLRYKLLYQFCLKRQIKFLFLGHHLGDVAENFLIRLFRGSSLDGLSAMAKISDYKKIKLVRPLLSIGKEQLIAFLQSKKISWFEDETNQEEKFLRNKIRKFLGSFDDGDVIQRRIGNAAGEVAEIRNWYDEVVKREAAMVLEFNQSGYFLLDVVGFKKIETKIAQKILALVLMEVSGQIYKPRLEKLQRFYQWLISDISHKPKNFYGCMIEKYDEKRLVVYRENKAIDLKNIEKFAEKTWLIDGRFLIDVKSKVPDLVVPTIEEIGKITEKKGVKKKIFASGLFARKQNKIVAVPVKFYGRTILGVF